ncbi:stage V sporulation protein AA [Paenibacillus protaetiae]|uniref:Stage V sporulation protein AA n=1 Tax=Paenibacillus protaetiae TaxID=2509456 RepID=A0A4P6ETI6_9BACL|nr:stage V sporulation protein AA [Paenibacillus protaetiae]QAY66214.1 stage V sporulation protein AA [Paenibacillus protaetiae]
MDNGSGQVLYLRLKKKITIRPERTVTLGQIARMLASDSETEQMLNEMQVYRHHAGDGNRVVLDILQIVKAIRETAPDLSIETFGEPQVLIMISKKPAKPRITVLIAVWLLLFFGAGLAIMNFHVDVNMQEVQVRIVELLTGKKEEHPLWFQIPYSIGIGLGMAVFFNHLFRKKFNEEPNPLEVELYTYQENVNAYVIAEEMGKKQRGGEEGDG